VGPTDWNSGKQVACLHWAKLALMLDDAGRPAHKVCVETALAQLLQTDWGSAV
jgi:hypothetical protein